MYHLHSTQSIAVGTAVTGGPPHRSVREGLPHTAPPLGQTISTLGVDTCRGTKQRGQDSLIYHLHSTTSIAVGTAVTGGPPAQIRT
jgi:hypothetical protein